MQYNKSCPPEGQAARGWLGEGGGVGGGGGWGGQDKLLHWNENKGGRQITLS